LWIIETRCSERFLLNTFKIENKGDSEDKYNQERCKRDGKHAMTRSLRLCVKHILETYLNKNITESISLPKDISFLFKKSDLDDNYMTTLKQIVSAISSNNSSAQLSDDNDSFSEFIINNVIKNYYPNHISSQVLSINVVIYILFLVIYIYILIFVVDYTLILSYTFHYSLSVILFFFA
jgi:hypothetical protein